jgi:DNA-binding MarR family transcriptional regulator
MKRTLGTQLRHLIEQLDGAVERAYAGVGLDYRPRYTPVMRVLIDREAATVGEIAERAGISQPAATQTIGLMVKAGIASTGPGSDDARKRVVRLTAKGRALVPELQRCWKATALAAQSLDRDLAAPLGPVLDAALAALEKRSYDERIADARRELDGGAQGPG